MAQNPDLQQKAFLLNLLKQSSFSFLRQMDTELRVSSQNMVKFKHLNLIYGNVILPHASVSRFCPVPVLLLAWFT